MRQYAGVFNILFPSAAETLQYSVPQGSVLSPLSSFNAV